MTKTHGTNVHVIDGKTYVEVERRANVGEKVIVVDTEDKYSYEDGDIFTVTESVEENAYQYEGVEVADGLFLYTTEYRTLEESQAPSNTEELIANLVRRVAALERQLVDTQNNVERQGVEIAEVEADIRTLDERTQPKLTPIEEALAEAIANELKKRGVRI